MPGIAEQMDRLRADLARQQAELDRQRDEIAVLRAQRMTQPPAESPRGEGRALSRRALLRGAGTAAAAGVGGALLAARPAGAADPNDVVLGVSGQNAGANETGITSTAGINAATFKADNTNTSGFGTGISGSAPSVGVSGSSTNGTGVSGTSSNGAGVAGNSSNTTGVFAQSTFGTSLVVSDPEPNQNGTHLRLVPGVGSGAPAGGNHTLGQFWVDSTGVLFQCVVAGTPGTWVRQRPFVPAAPGPVRVYDSRPGEVPVGVTKGQLNPGQERVVNVGLNGAVPTFASAVLCNLSVVSTVNAGFLAMFKEDIVWPGHSNVNWSASNQITGNNATSAVRLVSTNVNVKVRCGGSGGTHFIVDVLGHYT